MKNKQPQLVVSGIIMNEEGLVLAGQRVREPQTGQYCFPGGKVEDESLEEALAREIKEETNLDVIDRPQFLLYTEHVRTDGRRAVVLYYIVRWAGRLVNSDHNCKAWEWLHWSELEQVPLTKGLQEFFKKESLLASNAR